MNPRAKELIDKYELVGHEEGGYYKRVYCSIINIDCRSFPNKIEGNRPILTSIYYLLCKDQISAFHRIKSDEIWYHHEGDSLSIYYFSDLGELKMCSLGRNINDTQQVCVSKDTWFAAKIDSQDFSEGYSFVSCAVSPGFDYQDFELADRQEMMTQYPEYQKQITELTVG